MLERREGHIVAVSSVQGRIAMPQRSAYTASKHALQAFSDSLRAEVADKGIKVTVISPGYISTQLSLNALTQDGKTYGGILYLFKFFLLYCYTSQHIEEDQEIHKI